MDTSTPTDRVAAIVALKALPEAKSRLASLHPSVRARLARVMALDTLTALAPAVDRLVVVSDQPDLPAALGRHGINAQVITEPDGGDTAANDALNRALAHGAEQVAVESATVDDADGFGAVLACVGDLPALQTSSVSRVLAAARSHRRSFLPDHDGHGTTMLISRSVALDPLYGREIDGHRSRGSAERHELSGATRLSLGDLPDARWDVDTLDDLAVARDLGLGPATAAMIDPSTGAVGGYLAVTVVGATQATLTVDARRHEHTMPLAAYDGDPAHLVPGRRVHAIQVGRNLRCWL